MTGRATRRCVALFSLFLGACAAAPDGSDPDSEGEAGEWAPLGGSRECRLSERETYEQYSRCMSSCLESVLAFPDLDCQGVCRDSWCVACNPQITSCYLHEYEFHGGEVFSDLKASCAAAAARDQRCAMSSINPNCEAVAIVESRDMATVYDCVASTACAESPDACFPSPGTTLADSVCDVVEERCYTKACTREGRAYLQQIEPWLRQDALDAAAACLAEGSCGDVEDCLYAWQRLVLEGAAFLRLFG